MKSLLYFCEQAGISSSIISPYYPFNSGSGNILVDSGVAGSITGIISGNINNFYNESGAVFTGDHYITLQNTSFNNEW
jgi:hypothetical protein